MGYKVACDPNGKSSTVEGEWQPHMLNVRKLMMYFVDKENQILLFDLKLTAANGTKTSDTTFKIKNIFILHKYTITVKILVKN